MTPRSLFIIILRILGLFMTGEVISSAYSLIFNYLAYRNDYYTDGIYVLLFSIVPLATYICLAYILIMKPAIIIDKMQLDQQFYEEQFSMSMDSHLVTRISIIIVGSYLLIESAPNLFKEIIAYYQNSITAVLAETRNFKAQGIAYSGTKIVIAYIMLTNSEYLTNFIMKKTDQG